MLSQTQASATCIRAHVLNRSSRSRSPRRAEEPSDIESGESECWPVANWATHFLAAAHVPEPTFQAALETPLVACWQCQSSLVVVLSRLHVSSDAVFV